MTLSNNLSLNLFNRLVDLDSGFETLRLNLDGPTNSNMTLIDTYMGTMLTLVPLLTTFTTGSYTTSITSLNSASATLVSITGSATTIDAKFEKLHEFSGSGQMDFSSIPQTYTHLLILGVAAVESGSPILNVGMDFNSDSGSSNYVSLQWDMNGSSGSSEAFTVQQTGQILLGNVSGSSNSGYGGGFLGFIPNYSGSAGLFKSAMGLSVMSITNWSAGARGGGSWKNTDPITQIRMFGNVDNDSTRLNFIANTKISIYGIL